MAFAVDQVGPHVEPTLGQLEPARATYAANPGPAGARRGHIRSQPWASKGQFGTPPPLRGPAGASLGYICRHSGASQRLWVSGMADMHPALGQLGPIGVTSAANPGPALGRPGPHAQAPLGQLGALGRRNGGCAANPGPAGASQGHIHTHSWTRPGLQGRRNGARKCVTVTKFGLVAGLWPTCGRPVADVKLWR